MWRRIHWINVLFLLLGSSVGIVLLLLYDRPFLLSRFTPLPQDAFVQVYFNHSVTSEYTEPYRKLKRSGDDLEKLLLDAIAKSQSTVDVAVQELRLPLIAKALVARKQAGVKVRVILENTYSRPWSAFTPTEIGKFDARERSRYNDFVKLIDNNTDGKLNQTEINSGDALVILKNAGIPIIDDTADGSKGSSLMHHKFVVIDGNQVIVTSANFTTSDIHGDFTNLESRGNANNLLKIKSLEVASLFTKEFNLMWGDGVGGKSDSQFGVKKVFRPAQAIRLGGTTITVQFSPTSPQQPWNQSSNGLINQTLESATQSADLALFVFSEQKLADTLETDAQHGVKIRTLIEPSFAFRYYSEGLDMMGVALSNHCKYEANNHPWKEAIATAGIPRLPPGDLLHHKFAVIDKQTVITGSHNWSEAANNNNDETVLVVQSPRVAAHFNQEFERLYHKAVLGVPTTVQQKIETQKKECPQITTVKTVASLAIVNLNTATQAELESLPGIGTKLAQQIILTRQQKPFTSLQDFDRVPGVGASLLQKLEGRVTW